MWSKRIGDLLKRGGGGDNMGKTNTLEIEVGLRQNTVLGETAPPTSQFVRFFILSSTKQ